MNKIVRNYPVDKLPSDLREGLPEHGWVEIELRPKEQAMGRVSPASLAGSVPNTHGVDEQVIKYIRELRDDN